jgi:hypothetical protein
LLTVYMNSLLNLRIFMKLVHISVHLTTPADSYVRFLMSSMRQDHILVVLSHQSISTSIHIGGFSHPFIEPRKQVFGNSCSGIWAMYSKYLRPKTHLHK